MNVPPGPNRILRVIGIAALLAIVYFTVIRKPARVEAQAPSATNQPSASAGTAATNLAVTNSTATNAAVTNSATTNPAAGAGSTNSVATNAPAAPPTNAFAALPNNQPPPSTPPGAQPAPATNAPPGLETGEEVQVTFQNANVDMIVQWLAKYTGKSVVKHPRVQCQLSIVSSRKLAPREALNLVYRALSLEGFTVIETSKSILIVPEGQEPKTTPQLVNGGDNDIPEGRQRLIRIFQLENVQPADVRDKIKTVLSEKATVEIVDRANQLIITDYTENIRLATELIRELDVTSASDMTIEFFKLKHADAEEITTLLTQILNAQPARPSSGASSAPRPGAPPGMPPGMPMPSPSPSPASSPSNAAAGTGQVKIWPDKSANQLIVSAPKARLSEIRELLEILDTEKTEDVTMRVIPLANVSAADLVKEISPLYQKMSGKGPKDRVEVTANTRSNSLIVYSSEENFRAIQKLVAALDREEAQERTMRAFPLTNADAEDVAKQLETLHEGSQSQSRYPYYYYSFGSSSTDSKKVNFVADRRRNAVIVQGPPAVMESIAKLIETLDAPISDSTVVPKIFRLKYVSAVDIEEVLNELFLKRQQQRDYWDPWSGYSNDPDSRDSTGGKLYGKVRITSEPYSNSLIVSANSPEGLAAVEEVLKQLDAPSEAGETTMRVPLNFARAVTVASSLNILFAKAGAPALRPQAQQPQQPPPQPQQQQNNTSQNSFSLEQETKEDPYYSWLGGPQESPFGRGGDRTTARPVSDLVGRVRVVPDLRSNSLLITANLHFFPQIMKLINDLDEPTPQVLIEAKIIEVASDFRDKLGVRWSPDPNTFTSEDLDDSVLIQSQTSYSDVFAGSKIAESLRTGVFDASVNLNVLIQFLRKNLNAKVLAEPQLNIADNELGKLFVGSQVPFLSGSINTVEGGRNDTFNYRDVGVILEVTPHINSSDEIALRIRTESSNIRAGETLFGAFILDTRNFRTDLMVKNGETVVLGGIIQREQSKTDRKVPVLGSVPGLGWLFRKKDDVAREVELMVFLRPKITRTPEQAAELLRAIERKTPLIRAWDQNQPIPEPGETPREE